MKFKKTEAEVPNSRTIRLTDKEGVTLEVMSVNDSKPFPFMISVNHHAASGDIFGMTRAKALKLAWAIIDELNPSMLA